MNMVIGSVVAEVLVNEIDGDCQVPTRPLEVWRATTWFDEFAMKREVLEAPPLTIWTPSENVICFAGARLMASVRIYESEAPKLTWAKVPDESTTHVETPNRGVTLGNVIRSNFEM